MIAMADSSSAAVVPLAGFSIEAYRQAGFLARCHQEIDLRRPCWIVTLNLEMVSRGRLDPEYGALLKGCDLIVADGMPLVWGSRLKRGIPSLPERLPGSDLTVELLRMVPAAKIAILGGQDPIVALRKLGIPDAEKAYIFNGKIAATLEQADVFAAELNARGREIVFLALGVPKQDRLAALLRSRLNQGLVLGVGGSFELIAGQLKRAPKWMRNYGFEWLFRLLQEPRRLGYRYLVLYWVGGFALAGDIIKSWFRPNSTR